MDNGLILRFFDAGNRYFGDYHRVSVIVDTILPLDHSTLAGIDVELLTRARTRFGAALVIRKNLERMGVASAQVARVQQDLVASFLAQTRHYQSRPDFPARLLRAELARKPASKPLPKLK